MPRPIYRYAAAKFGVLDGAVFGFAQGTNIEAIAVVEAIETANSTKWRIGFSRLTRYAIKVRRDGEIVYDVPRINWTRNTASYRYLWQEPRPYPFDEAPRRAN